MGWTMGGTWRAVGGTGMFEGAGGNMRVPGGILDLINGTAEWTMSGRVSIADRSRRHQPASPTAQ